MYIENNCIINAMVLEKNILIYCITKIEIKNLISLYFNISRYLV